MEWEVLRQRGPPCILRIMTVTEDHDSSIPFQTLRYDVAYLKCS